MTQNENPSRDELLNALQSFLETFTQELTEQRFIPAFQKELQKLQAALAGLSQAEETLQGIARGVERLREVFAPAGARLLDGAKEVEEAMRQGVSQIKEQADAILRDLLETHEKLETSIQKEAALAQRETPVGLETVQRTVAVIEERLEGLTAQVETLCRRLSAETDATRSDASPAGSEVLEAQATGLSVPPELNECLEKARAAVRQELERYRQEIASALASGRTEDEERFARLQSRITEALAEVGPHVHEALDSAVARLRDEIQTLILAETEARAARIAQGEGTEVPHADLAAALAASETRIVREIAALSKVRREEDSEGERILRDLVRTFDEVAERSLAQMAAGVQAVRESLAALQRVIPNLQDTSPKEHEDRDAACASLQTLAEAQQEFRQEVAEDFRAVRQQCADLAAMLARAEQVVSTSTELALSESRTLRERIDNGLAELRERLERGLCSEARREQESVHRIAEAWSEALTELRDFITSTLSSRGEAIVARLDKLAEQFDAGSAGTGNLPRELQTELRRAGTALETQVDALSRQTERLTVTLQQHAETIGNEIENLRERHEQHLAALKEAIRVHYNESAARLREVIELSYQSFVQQTAAIPQSLDRFAHLVQSLHQGDQIGLQAIASDTRNLLNLSSEKLELLLSDSTAIKKFFPLLDRKLEKHALDLDAVHKALAKQERETAELQTALGQARETQGEQFKSLKNEIARTRGELTDDLAQARAETDEIKKRLDALTENDLPAFRRELSALLASKLDFIENSLHEKQESLRHELVDRWERERVKARKANRMIAVLLALLVLLQLVLLLGIGHGGRL